MRAIALALLALTAAAALGGLVVGVVYAPRDGVLMGLFMLACGIPVIGAAHLLVARRRANGMLGRQFASVVALTIGLVMLGVFVVALLMFISPHDALVMAVLLLLAGGLTAYTTWQLSRDVIAQRDAAERARRDLVAAVSHDLRTPLTARFTRSASCAMPRVRSLRSAGRRHSSRTGSSTMATMR